MLATRHALGTNALVPTSTIESPKMNSAGTRGSLANAGDAAIAKMVARSRAAPGITTFCVGGSSFKTLSGASTNVRTAVMVQSTTVVDNAEFSYQRRVEWRIHP